MIMKKMNYIPNISKQTKSETNSTSNPTPIPINGNNRENGADDKSTSLASSSASSSSDSQPTIVNNINNIKLGEQSQLPTFPNLHQHSKTMPTQIPTSQINSIGMINNGDNTFTMTSLVANQVQQTNLDNQFRHSIVSQPIHAQNYYGNFNSQQTMAPNNIALSNTSNSTNNGLIPTKLYVTNFPFTCTQRQIQDLFSQFGQVVECTLKKDYYAYILFTSSKCALNAYKNANGYKMFGRKLTVHLATSKKSQSHLTAAAAAASSSSSSISPGPPVALSTSVPFFAPSLSGDLPPGDQIPRIVHVRNFPETCTQQQIRDVFSQYGDIVECLILHDSYAFVHFKSPVDARLALQNTNNKSFFSSTAPLLVQYSRSKFKQVQATPQQQQVNSNVTSPSYQSPQMSTGECNAMTGSCFTVPANRRPSNFRKPINLNDGSNVEEETGSLQEPKSFGEDIIEYNDLHQHNIGAVLNENLMDEFEDELVDELTLEHSLIHNGSVHAQSQQHSNQNYSQSRLNPVSMYHNRQPYPSQQQHPQNQDYHQLPPHHQHQQSFYPFNGNNGQYNISKNYPNIPMSYSPVMGDASFAPNGNAQSQLAQSQQNLQQCTRTKLYVTNFPEEMDQEEMKQLFNQFGQVLECTIMWNQYAFVHFGSVLEAEKAMNGVKGTQYKGFKLSVQWSTSSKYQQPKQHQSRLYSHQQQQQNIPISSSSCEPSRTGNMTIQPKILERPSTHSMKSTQNDEHSLGVSPGTDIMAMMVPTLDNYNHLIVSQQQHPQFVGGLAQLVVSPPCENVMCINENTNKVFSSIATINSNIVTTTASCSSSSSSIQQASEINASHQNPIKGANIWQQQGIHQQQINTQVQPTWASIMNVTDSSSSSSSSTTSSASSSSTGVETTVQNNSNEQIISSSVIESSKSNPVASTTAKSGPFKVSFSEIVRSSATHQVTQSPSQPQPQPQQQITTPPSQPLTKPIQKIPSINTNTKTSQVNGLKQNRPEDENRRHSTKPNSRIKTNTQDEMAVDKKEASRLKTKDVSENKYDENQSLTPTSEVDQINNGEYQTKPEIQQQQNRRINPLVEPRMVNPVVAAANAAYLKQQTIPFMNGALNANKPPSQDNDLNINKTQYQTIPDQYIQHSTSFPTSEIAPNNIIQYHQHLHQLSNNCYPNPLYKPADLAGMSQQQQRPVMWQTNGNNIYNPMVPSNHSNDIFIQQTQQEAQPNSADQYSKDTTALSTAFVNLAVNGESGESSTKTSPSLTNKTSNTFNNYVLFPSDSFGLSTNDLQENETKNVNLIQQQQQQQQQNSSMYYHIEDVLANLIR